MLRSDEQSSTDRSAPGDDRGAGSADHLLSEAAEAEARAPGDEPSQKSREGGEEEKRDGAKPDEKKGKDDAGKDGKGEDETGAEEPKRSKLEAARDFVRRHPVGVAVAAVVLIAAIVAGVLWWLHARHFESTDDAFIDARQFALAPKVGGYVTEVLVTDNRHVDAGAVIARIDKRDYLVALQQAEAQVEAARANVASAGAQKAAQQSTVTEAQAQVRLTQAAVDFAKDENARAQELVQRGAGTVQRAQQTASELIQAQANLARSQATLNATVRQIAVLEAQEKSAAANVDQARAQLEQARLNLSYTDVTAAQAGRVARLTGATGQLVQAGQALSMFVPDEMWVTANFKETQLADMRAGQGVDMTIDAYPGRSFRGHVDSVQSGSGTAFSLLPAQNATGNYVKVVQRVPVKLVFDDLPGDVTIGPGMSVVPKVRVR